MKIRKVDAFNRRTDVEAFATKLRAKFGGVYSNIWELGYHTALSITNLLALTWDNVDLDEELIYLTKDGDNVDAIELDESSLRILKAMREKSDGNTYVFQSQSPRLKNCPPRPLTRDIVSKRFSKIGEQFGKRVNTQSMRKSRGAVMLSSGKSIHDVSQVLRHQNITTTTKYLEGVELLTCKQNGMTAQK